MAGLDSVSTGIERLGLEKFHSMYNVGLLSYFSHTWIGMLVEG